MLTAYLREETRSYYDRLERSALSRSLVDAELSPEFYVSALGAIYGFYAPMEARLLGAASWPDLGFDLESRLKTPLIEKDLTHFGLEGELLQALPLCQRLPRLPDLPAALGCLYVLEGATLSGQFIACQLARTLRVASGSGASFFSSYGAQVPSMWKHFKRFVERHGAGYEDSVIAASSATFAALESWYAERYRWIVGAGIPEAQYAMAD